MTGPACAGSWTFEDLGSRRPVKAELTAREREVAACLREGLSSKEIGQALAISYRTVEIYRARLMRKYKASTTNLVRKLTAGSACCATGCDFFNTLTVRTLRPPSTPPGDMH